MHRRIGSVFTLPFTSNLRTQHSFVAVSRLEPFLIHRGDAQFSVTGWKRRGSPSRQWRQTVQRRRLKEFLDKIADTVSSERKQQQQHRSLRDWNLGNRNPTNNYKDSQTRTSFGRLSLTSRTASPGSKTRLYRKRHIRKQRGKREDRTRTMETLFTKVFPGLERLQLDDERHKQPLNQVELMGTTGVKHHRGHFRTKDGSSLHYHAWFPCETPETEHNTGVEHERNAAEATSQNAAVEAIVIFVHGLHEHAGRFSPWARETTKNGIGVYGLDHRGHGRSEGMHGYFKDVQECVEDLVLFTKYCRSRHPGVPIIYLGHSLGGYLSLEAARLCTQSGCPTDTESPEEIQDKLSEEEIEHQYKYFTAISHYQSTDDEDDKLRQGRLSPAAKVEAEDTEQRKLPLFLQTNHHHPSVADVTENPPKSPVAQDGPCVSSESSTSSDGDFSEGSSRDREVEDMDLEQDLPLVNGVIVHSPLISVSEQSTPNWFLEALGKALNLTPLSRAPFVEGSGGKSYHDSVSEERLAEEINDPLVYSGKLRIGTGLAIREAVTHIEGCLGRYNFPLLIQHGTADRVCHISGSRRLIALCNAKDKCLIEYEGAHHDLLRERNAISTDVLHHTISWIEQHKRKFS